MAFNHWLFGNQGRISIVLAISIVFAVASTALLIIQLLTMPTATISSTVSGSYYLGPPVGLVQPTSGLLSIFEGRSIILAPTSWVIVGGLWIWRGRTKAAWTSLGFDSEVFELFMRMKGGETRKRMMDSLSMPKDRLQLAQELGLDWKAVDHHIVVLCKYGFVHEEVAYGRVKMYELTDMGKVLLRLLKETQSGIVQPNSATEASLGPSLQETP